MPTTNARTYWLVALLASLTLGCAFLTSCSEKTSDETTETTVDPLSRVSSTTLFAPNAVIAVCWETKSTATSKQKEWVREAVENSWMATTGVKFTFWADCPVQSSAKFVTVFATNTTGTSACAKGRAALHSLPDLQPDNTGASCGLPLAPMIAV